MVGLLSVLFVSLYLQAAAQEAGYTVTETELTELESILMNLQTSRQNLLLQASALTTRLRAQEQKASSLAASLQQAENKANTLNNQLQTERNTLKSLRVSYNEYEKEAARQIAEMQTVIDKQRRKIHRLTITVIMLSTALVGFIIFAIVKLKRFFPFLP